MKLSRYATTASLLLVTVCSLGFSYNQDLEYFANVESVQKLRSDINLVTCQDTSREMVDAHLAYPKDICTYPKRIIAIRETALKSTTGECKIPEGTVIKIEHGHETVNGSFWVKFRKGAFIENCELTDAVVATKDVYYFSDLKVALPANPSYPSGPAPKKAKPKSESNYHGNYDQRG